MKRLLLTIAFLSAAAAAACAMTAQWNTDESRHFVVFFRSADARSVTAVAAKAEGYYAAISRDLGLRARRLRGQRHERITIYLFDTRDQFQANTGEPAWADASSIQRLRVIYSFAGAKEFLVQALPHEIAHVLLKEAVGFDNRAVPAWFEEGFSSLYEEKDAASAAAAVGTSIADGSYLALDRLSGLDIRGSNDAALLGRFYAQSSSIVRYLKAIDGGRKFRRLIRNMRSAESFERALTAAYGFKGIEELEEHWKEYLNR
ncbi:MAG: peptidase MA family metallohydrolase [Candidatus Omnitrophica bacterium]|nr:peptidase MA family metallohydrolase [Candidatus Omnitrophota bacterium]